MTGPSRRSNLDDLTVSVRVVPRSSRDELAGMFDGVLRVKLMAPPVEGAANERLVKFMARELGVGKSCISLVSGEKSRQKVVVVSGLSPDERERIIAYLGSIAAS